MVQFITPPLLLWQPRSLWPGSREPLRGSTRIFVVDKVTFQISGPQGIMNVETKTWNRDLSERKRKNVSVYRLSLRLNPGMSHHMCGCEVNWPHDCTCCTRVFPYGFPDYIRVSLLKSVPCGIPDSIREFRFVLILLENGFCNRK
jgi:hypothetical protein